jgi:hypothetical protein
LTGSGVSVAVIDSVKNDSLAYVRGVAQGSSTITAFADGTAMSTPGALVKRNFFPGTGVLPLLGRLFTDADWTQGARRLVLLSEDLWRQRFGAAADIIGKSIDVDGAPATIIAVLPRGFDAPPGAKFWYSEPPRPPPPNNE